MSVYTYANIGFEFLQLLKKINRVVLPSSKRFKIMRSHVFLPDLAHIM